MSRCKPKNPALPPVHVQMCLEHLQHHKAQQPVLKSRALHWVKEIRKELCVNTDSWHHLLTPFQMPVLITATRALFWRIFSCLCKGLFAYYNCKGPAQELSCFLHKERSSQPSSSKNCSSHSCWTVESYVEVTDKLSLQSCEIARMYQH